jgi:hypothetical protein
LRQAGFKHSEETKAKMRLAMQNGAKYKVSETLKRKIMAGELVVKRVSFEGRRHSEESKHKMSLAHHNISDETRRKMSEAKKNNPDYIAMLVARNKKPISEERKRKLRSLRLGCKLSEETKLKLSLAHKGQIISGAQRKLISTAQKGVLDGPLSKEHKDKISNGAAKATMEGKHQCRAEYSGIKMQSAEEALFAMWCDKNNIVWKYQPIMFYVRSGVRYIPDFLLTESNEFVEISAVSLRQRDKSKFDAFVSSGNVLHYINSKSFSGVLGENTHYCVK